MGEAARRLEDHPRPTRPLRLLACGQAPAPDAGPSLAGYLRGLDSDGPCLACGSPLRPAQPGLLVCDCCGAEIEQLPAA